jgi:hypothetical protein
MRNAMEMAFIVVATAPLIGIWRGHVWAKTKGMILRGAPQGNNFAA